MCLALPSAEERPQRPRRVPGRESSGGRVSSGVSSSCPLEQFAAGLERIFVDDVRCHEDLQRFGGSVEVDVAMSSSRFSHRADWWVYVRLWQEGGSYVDGKMALL